MPKWCWTTLERAREPQRESNTSSSGVGRADWASIRRRWTRLIALHPTHHHHRSIFFMSSGDALGEAIVAQGITDERLDETSAPIKHSVEVEVEPRGGRASTESNVSFGFRHNLLPLSLSSRGHDGGDDDDDATDDGDGDSDKGGRSAGRNGIRREYGDVEGNSAPSRLRSNRVRRRRDPARSMGLIDGVALTVGLQIGSGIFSSPGVVTLNTGSIGSSLVVWLFSGLLAWCGAASFAELGSAIPQNGGAQAYLNYSLGPLPSYLFSWTAIVALKPGSGAIIAIIFGEYLARVIYHTTSSPHDGEGGAGEEGLSGIPDWSIKLIASLIVILVSTLNALSAKLGTRTQVATTIVKLFALIAVPIMAIVFASRGHMPPTSREAFSSFSSLFSGSSTSPSSYALALYSGLWAYDGWDQVSYVAGEMRNVSRDVPRVIHSSMTLVVLFFSITVLSYFLVLPPTLVKQTNTVALDFGSAILGTGGGVAFSLLVVFSCFGALNSQIYTSSRLVYAAGREGYLPSIFGSIHKRTATPLYATIFQAVMVLIFILFGSGFASLVSFYGVCSYTWYFLTVVGLLVLRVKEPNLERPYRVWLATPVVFATTALFLLLMPIASAPLEAGAAFLFMLAGLPAWWVSTGRAAAMCGRARGVGGGKQPGVLDHNGLGDELGDEEEEEEGDEEEAMEMLASSRHTPASAAVRRDDDGHDLDDSHQDEIGKGKQRAIDDG